MRRRGHAAARTNTTHWRIDGIKYIRKSTATIPVVLGELNDPSGGGFGASLSRPVGNVTGFSSGCLPYWRVSRFVPILLQVPNCRVPISCCKNPTDTVDRCGSITLPRSQRVYPQAMRSLSLPKSRVQPKEILIGCKKTRNQICHKETHTAIKAALPWEAPPDSPANRASFA